MARTKPKNRRKKNTMQGRAQRVAPSELRYYGVLFLSGWDHTLLIDMRTGDPVPATTEIDIALKRLRYDWTVVMAVLCRDSEGEPYLRLQKEPFPKSYQKDIVDQQVELHRGLIKSCNHQHYEGFGWISNPYGWDLSNEDAMYIFEKHGAWSEERYLAEALEAAM